MASRTNALGTFHDEMSGRSERIQRDLAGGRTVIWARMATGHRTWRNVDGERIEGTWRHPFIHNGGTYFLTDLLIYGVGTIDCWGLETLEGFAGKLASGVPLTSVRRPAFELGRRAGRLLLEHSGYGTSHRHEHLVLRPELLVRRSTLGPPSR